MDYPQHNPIPLPQSGAFEEVETTMNSVFDWQYALEQQGLMALYEKGKANNWNAVELEARHVEVYHRDRTEKMGVAYPVVPSLQSLLDDIIKDPRWDVTFLGMQIMVEGLALAAFSMMRMMMAGEPLIQDITTRIMADESRHVAFGVLSLGDYYKNELSGNELREREDFVIEATHLLRERLQMEPVFERLEFDVPVWTQWANDTPFMKGFRQMTFSKIVPNLKRLGLLTPRVREAFAQMDLLRFEHLKDSVEEAEPQPPEELVKLLMEFLNTNVDGQGKPTVAA
jgi:hypothetical protein